jgi:V-type H+-transporting ATPase subunit a
MKGSNALYRRSMLDFVFEFLPQIIILIAMFGYMDLMIVIKWLTDWEGRTAYAPSVIGTMIDMFLNLGQPTLPTDAPLFATWAEQTHIELTLLMIVAICVPAMLFVKPIVLSLTAPKSHKPAVVAPAAAELAAINDKDDDFKPIEGTPTPAGDATSPDAGKPTPMAQAAVNPDDKYDLRANIVASFSDGVVHPHDFGELMIHQLIETIEFVLGTVSNTASYLRLWALSLAHSQLAKVFFDNCLIGGFQSGSVISLYLGFFVFMGATIFVLMMMDLLECTLHTLRLHWVEFQNKFFKGQGIAFAPVRIEQTVREN